MLRILLCVSLASLIGAGLASGSLSWPIRPGYVGAAGMLLGAMALRRSWATRVAAAPGSPEQALWFGVATYAVVAGYLAATLWRQGPQFELHTRAGHALGVDTWALALAGLIGYFLARSRDRRRDERDQVIAMTGLRWAFHALLAMLFTLATFIGYRWAGVGDWSTAVTAHALILMGIVGCIVDGVVRLRAYVAEAAFEVRAE